MYYINRTSNPDCYSSDTPSRKKTFQGLTSHDDEIKARLSAALNDISFLSLQSAEILTKFQATSDNTHPSVVIEMHDCINVIWNHQHQILDQLTIIESVMEEYVQNDFIEDGRSYEEYREAVNSLKEPAKKTINFANGAISGFEKAASILSGAAQSLGSERLYLSRLNKRFVRDLPVEIKSLND